jgi:hypothetical protein
MTCMAADDPLRLWLGYGPLTMDESFSWGSLDWA